MIMQWLDAREATRMGIQLAEQYALQQAAKIAKTHQTPARTPPVELNLILQRADKEIRELRLNFYKKAKLANSFKWRLLESGLDKTLADTITQALVLHISGNHSETVPGDNEGEVKSHQTRRSDAKSLLIQGDSASSRGAYSEAIDFYSEFLTVVPRHAAGQNNLGAALYKLGRYPEAEACFAQALKVEPNFPDAYSNMGSIHLVKGQYAAAEQFLRRAIKLNPRYIDARVNLGLTLSLLNRLRDAEIQFDKALKYQPRNADALAGLAYISMTEGSFDRAESLLTRAIESRPRMPRALSLQASLRKMTPANSAWLRSAEELAASDIAPLDESELRFAIAKYYDDVQEFEPAFQNYKRANELAKSVAEPFDLAAYQAFVDVMLRTYTSDALRRAGTGGSTSTKPVFVVGMPRSGTSLTEQIISSHPYAKGAGELAFWANAIEKYDATLKSGPPSETARNELADAYLRVLEANAGDALRIVDKAPVNSDYLGVIHTVFPDAKFIYMQRDPIDSCLSCYFQKFVVSQNFTTDLSDLANYYRQHARIMTHWRAVLPPGTMLDVQYEELVANQEACSRKIIDFLGLDWDARVMDFHATKRAVATGSFWQVRQKIYTSSVQRWRNYEKFIGPLRNLKKIG